MMKVTRITSKASKARKASARSGDVWRVSLALVFILFASIASRDHETPEKTLEAREVAAESQAERTAHAREQKQKLSETPFLKRLTGINGTL